MQLTAIRQQVLAGREVAEETFDLLCSSYLVSLEPRCVRNREELGINCGFRPLAHSKGCARADSVETVMSPAWFFNGRGTAMDWALLWEEGPCSLSGFGSSGWVRGL